MWALGKTETAETCRWAAAVAFGVAMFAVQTTVGAELGAELSGPARLVAEQIRREALLAPNGPSGRPLPLLSHWNMGSQGRGWTPQYQIELLQSGHRILPLMG